MFAVTLAVEAPVYVIALRRFFGTRGAMFAVVVLNLCTHPLAFAAFARDRSVSNLMEVEVCVWLVEALLLVIAGRSRLARLRITPAEALFASLFANALSTGVGLLL